MASKTLCNFLAMTLWVLRRWVGIVPWRVGGRIQLLGLVGWGSRVATEQAKEKPHVDIRASDQDHQRYLAMM